MSYVDPWSTAHLVTRASTSSDTCQMMAEWSSGTGGSRWRSATGAGSGSPVAAGRYSVEASPSTGSTTGCGGAAVLGQSVPARLSRRRLPGSTVQAVASNSTCTSTGSTGTRATGSTEPDRWVSSRKPRVTNVDVPSGATS